MPTKVHEKTFRGHIQKLGEKKIGYPLPAILRLKETKNPTAIKTEDGGGVTP